MTPLDLFLAITALPFRLPLRWFIHFVFWVAAGRFSSPERGWWIANRVGGPASNFYCRLWGKDGRWHNKYTVEHWPEWLQ